MAKNRTLNELWCSANIGCVNKYLFANLFVKFKAYMLFLLPSSDRIDRKAAWQFEQQMCYTDWLNSKSEWEKKESTSNIFRVIEVKQNMGEKLHQGLRSFSNKSFQMDQHHIEFVLHSIRILQNLHGADGTFFSIHTLLVFSLSAISRRVLHALLSPSLFVLSRSACVPLKLPLLLCLWCELQRRQWVLTCQLSWPPEGWLCAGVC